MLIVQLQIVEYFFSFVWDNYFFCSDDTILDLQLRRSANLAVLVTIAFQVFYAFGVMFTACEICQRMSLAFDECNDMVDQFEWYFLPDDIQRTLPLFIQFAQQSVDIKWFGSVASDRETFKYVSNWLHTRNYAYVSY